jgi:hypothetical protein
MSKRFLGLIFTSLCAVSALAAQPGNLRAGAAKVEITPSAGEFPFPLVFSGGIMPQYVGVHDPLYARALVLDDGGTQVAFVIVDVTEIPKSAEFRRTVAQAVGIPEANLVLAASHTHSEPTMYYYENPQPVPPAPAGTVPTLGGPRIPLTAEQTARQDAQWAKELRRVIDGAAEAARQAKAQLKPATVAFARGEAYVNNRNKGSASNAAEAAGDKNLDVVRFMSTDGTPIAQLVDYGVPGTVLLHNVTRDTGAEVSGDILGTAAQLVENQPGNTAVTLFASGADGDQSPIFSARPPAVGKLAPVKAGAGAWMMLDVLGGTLANSVLGVVNKMPAGTGSVKLSAAARTVSCPTEKRTVDRATGSVTVADGPPAQIPLSVIRIGDIAVAGVGANLGSIIGQHLKSASPLPQTTLVTVLAGSAGYILDDATLASPAGKTGNLKPGCAENAIVQGLVAMIKAKP